MMLRTSAAVMTVIAAALVAANWNARLMVAGFIIFIVATTRLDDRWLAGEQGLVGHPEWSSSPDQPPGGLALASKSRE